MNIDTLVYRKAFQNYLRYGLSIELQIKAAEEHPTSFYIWRTMGDDKVRPEHAANEGKVFAWDNPPPTGHPGADFGCRCMGEPFPTRNPAAYQLSNRDVIIYYPNGHSETRSGGSSRLAQQ